MHLINTKNAKSAVQRPHYASPLDIRLTVSLCLIYISPGYVLKDSSCPGLEPIRNPGLFPLDADFNRTSPDAMVPGVCPARAGLVNTVSPLGERSLCP